MMSLMPPEQVRDVVLGLECGDRVLLDPTSQPHLVTSIDSEGSFTEIRLARRMGDTGTQIVVHGRNVEMSPADRCSETWSAVTWVQEVDA